VHPPSVIHRIKLTVGQVDSNNGGDVVTAVGPSTAAGRRRTERIVSRCPWQEGGRVTVNGGARAPHEPSTTASAAPHAAAASPLLWRADGRGGRGGVAPRAGRPAGRVTPPSVAREQKSVGPCSVNTRHFKRARLTAFGDAAPEGILGGYLAGG